MAYFKGKPLVVCGVPDLYREIKPRFATLCTNKKTAKGYNLWRSAV